MTMNYKLEQTWKDAIATFFNVLLWHLPGDPQSQDSRCPDRDSNQASPTHKSEALLLVSTRLVFTVNDYRN
jgi:hypothetical protein